MKKMHFLIMSMFEMTEELSYSYNKSKEAFYQSAFVL